MPTKLTWILGGIAVLLLLGGAVAGGIALMDDDDGEDLLSVDLAQGASHSVNAEATAPPRVVEADYELGNDGPGDAVVVLTLAGPDGTILETASKRVGSGQHVEIEVEHAFASAGPAGTYTATITVQQGSVHLTEGSVDIDEAEDGEDDEEE